MAIFNADVRFRDQKRMSLPVVKVPKNVREAFHIDMLYENGIAKLEKGKKNCLYDRCYLFEEINYINKDDGEKTRFLNQFMAWLKAMNVDFKMTVANEYQSAADFIRKYRSNKNKESYPETEKGIRDWIEEKMGESNPNVTTYRYLTVSCRTETQAEAVILLNAIDTVIHDMFRAWRGQVMRLSAKERLFCLHSLLRPGKKEEEAYLSFGKGHDWKNDILPRTIRQKSNFLVLDDTYVSVLFGHKYRGSIDADSFIRSFSHMEFPSFLTLDYAPVLPDIIEDKLGSASMNNERAISNEEEKKRKRNQISTGPSYRLQKRKEKIEEYADQINDNDETGFFVNFLLVVTAPDEETLAERVGQMEAIGRKEGVVIETADWFQLKALNTALPYGGRQVDYMRFFLASSVVALQPYYAQDIIDLGGYFMGINRTTKRLIFGNRKLLKNPHGIIIGHTGSGKSVIIKLTEILQTIIATDDDVLVLDPQNEFEEIIRALGGAYFDLTPKSGMNLNGFEVTEEVFYADKKTKEKFVATQTAYAKSLVAATMNNILFTQEHATYVSRATSIMYGKIFAQKKLKKQPTLKMLREELYTILSGEAGQDSHNREILQTIYNCLEEYTEGSCDMLAHPSTIRLDNRLVGFGLKNVPEDNWEAVMLTVMHYTSSRIEYNQAFQRAVHFVVDETQVICQKGTSAAQLNTAVTTYRKFGGICTMSMQNLTAALNDEKLTELFSNCDYKCFLDQGGVDANALREIQELSQTEFDALSTDQVGQGVMVWGKKVVLFDMRIAKENPLYSLISTNFHERAAQRAGKAGQESVEETVYTEADRTEQIILQMADFAEISARDILSVLDITQDEAEAQLAYLVEQGKLVETQTEGIPRYKKAG